MLSVIPLHNPREKLKHLQGFNDRKATWVVPDMETKLNLQEYLLSQKAFIQGDSVLRASELWQKLLIRTRPDLHVVSPDFARNLIADLLDQSSFKWAHTPGAPGLLYDYICQLIPILSHPEGDSQLHEWFSEKPESHARWGQWYELARQTWDVFLARGQVATQWVSGVLVNEFGFEQVWDRELVFDLGVELIQVEADLIRNLSRYTDVTVLEPNPHWRERFAKTLQAYDSLDEHRIRAEELSVAEPPVTCHKFTTMLSEVKFATAQVRKWADEGVPLTHIGVVMPDIEAYWPSLLYYLKEEGVPAQKAQVTRLHTLPDVARWLSGMRLRSGAVSTPDLELSTFTNRPDTAMGFDRFKRLFSQIYGAADLGRDVKLRQMYAGDVDRSLPLDRDEFIAWSLRFWPEEGETQWLERIYGQLFQECPLNLQMKLARWIQFIEQLAARCEITLSESAVEAVSITNLTSTDSLSCTHVIVLGLTESALRKMGATSIIYGDVLSIGSTLGFHLAYPDQNKLEFAARWLLEDDGREFQLCFPATDFNGSAQAPSLVWLELAIEQHAHEFLIVPPPTRWDEVQSASLEQVATLREWPESQQLKLVESIEQDLGLRELKAFAQDAKYSLSASSLERYLKCPFMFAAEKLFKLTDVTALDLDIDPRSRGQLMHAVFEALMKKPIDVEWTEMQLLELIDQARVQTDLELADDKLWPPLRQKYLALAQRFLAYERMWREQLPHVKPAGVEVTVNGYLHPDGRITKDSGAGAITFRGKIDRVDRDEQGYAVILDYKTSRASDGITSSVKWIERQSLQLALYTMAVEAGAAVELPPSEVMGAFFYVAKGMNRETGMRLAEFEGQLYPANRYQPKLTFETKQKLLKDVRELVAATLTRMRSGDFAPRPREVDLCQSCQWSSLCRAPHLN